MPPQGIKVLRDYPIITIETPHWYSQRTQAGLPDDPALAGQLAERGRRVHVTDIATMESIVTTTDSLGLAPAAAIHRGIDAGTLAILDVPDDQRALLQPAPIVLATMKDRPLPPSANALIDQIQSPHRHSP